MECFKAYVFFGGVSINPVQQTTSPNFSGDYIRACYFESWAQYRDEKVAYLPEDINTDLCSHLIYSFVGMEGNQLSAMDENDESNSTFVGM